MPLSIPSDLVVEKNRLFPDADVDGIWVELLEIDMPGGPPLRIVNNMDDVEWGGWTWTRFRFEPGEMSDGDDGDNKSVSIRVSNLAGTVQSEIETDDDCLVGRSIIYRYVHTGYPDDAPAIIGYFDILEGEAGDEWIEFQVGTENFYLNAFPRNTYNRNICRYQPHQTDTCPHANDPACDRTFATCLGLNRVRFFGGQPGIPGGVWDTGDSTGPTGESGISGSTGIPSGAFVSGDGTPFVSGDGGVFISE